MSGSLGGRQRAAPAPGTAVQRRTRTSARASAPTFEYVDGGTHSGSGTQSIGSVTMGGDPADTYYFLALVTEAGFNFTSAPAAPTHPGATLIATAGHPGTTTGFSANLRVYAFAPGVSPSTAAFTVAQGTPGGSRNYAWMLFKASDASPSVTAEFSVGSIYSGSGGGSGGDSETISDDAGLGLLMAIYSFPQNTGNAWTQTAFAFGDDLAANEQTGLLVPVQNNIHLNASFYPASGDGILTAIVASFTESGTWSGSQTHGAFGVGFRVPGL